MRTPSEVFSRRSRRGLQALSFPQALLSGGTRTTVLSFSVLTVGLGDLISHLTAAERGAEERGELRQGTERAGLFVSSGFLVSVLPKNKKMQNGVDKLSGLQ